MATDAKVTFHYEGKKEIFMEGWVHCGTLVDNEQIKARAENTLPGLHIFTSHDMEDYTKDGLWAQVINYAKERFETPIKIQIKTSSRVCVKTIN